MSTPVPGWYADPAGTPQLRWWDGTQWTQQYRPADSEQASPNAQANAAPASQVAVQGAATAQVGAAPQGDRRPDSDRRSLLSPRLRFRRDRAALRGALHPEGAGLPAR